MPDPYDEEDYDLDAVIEGRRPERRSRGGFWDAPGREREQEIEQPTEIGPEPQQPSEDVQRAHATRVYESKETGLAGTQAGGTQGRESMRTIQLRQAQARTGLEEAFSDMRPLDREEYVLLLGSARGSIGYVKGEERECEICVARWPEIQATIQRHGTEETWDVYDFAFVWQMLKSFEHFGPEGTHQHGSVAGRSGMSRKEHRETMQAEGWIPEPWGATPTVLLMGKKQFSPELRQAMHVNEKRGGWELEYPYKSTWFPFENWGRRLAYVHGSQREQSKIRTAYKRAAKKRQKSHAEKLRRREREGRFREYHVESDYDGDDDDG